METWQIKTVDELDHLAAAIVATVVASDQSEAVIIGLTGQLGAGKTTFVQALARHLGVTEPVTSPTFVVMKSYALQHETFDRLVHVDAYRIESDDEMRILGWQQLIAEPRTLICIEWPEKIHGLMPHDYYHLTLTEEAGVREVTFHYG